MTQEQEDHIKSQLQKKMPLTFSDPYMTDKRKALLKLFAELENRGFNLQL